MLLSYKLANENDELRRDILNLKLDIRKLNEEFNVYEKVKGIVDAITKKGIQWFDYSKLSPQEQRTYYQEAQDALRNPAIKNEMNKMINEFSEWGLKQAKDMKEIEALRFQVSGMQLLIERLSEIHNPDVKTPEVEEPFNSI